MKKISIIVPVYNMAEYVKRNIGCLTNQTYKNIEILLINDGSSDNSLEECRRAAQKDSRILVFDKENGGPGSARNFGLDRASGEYVYFFDIDDCLKSEAIEKLVFAMEEKGADLVACGFEMSDGKRVIKTVVKTDGYFRTGEETRRDYYEQLFMGSEKGIQGALWYKLFKLDLIREHGIEFPDLRRSEDVVFTARYVNYINSFTLIGDVLYTYYVNDNGKFWEKYPRDMYETAKKACGYMLDTAYGWNRDNTDVRNGIYQCFFGNVFESLCGIFNPALKMGAVKRYRRIREISKDFAEIVKDGASGINHPVFKYMLSGRYIMIYIRIKLHILRHILG